MNDFDRFLEFELRQILDPVVMRRAPRRRRRANGSPVLTIVSPQADAIVAVESVALPVRSAVLLP